MNPILQSPATTGIPWEFLTEGGWFMIPLAVTSVAGLAAIAYKFLSLASRHVIPGETERRLAALAQQPREDHLQRAEAECARGRSALDRLAATALRHRHQPRGEITAAVEAAAREETSRLHAGIGVLDTVITVAPLLGLLGTASGLVTIFRGLGETADHIAIARGIAEALHTTITGLAIAVPCVIAHSHFTRRIEVLTARLESILADLAQACRAAHGTR